MSSLYSSSLLVVLVNVFVVIVLNIVIVVALYGVVVEGERVMGKDAWMEGWGGWIGMVVQMGRGKG